MKRFLIILYLLLIFPLFPEEKKENFLISKRKAGNIEIGMEIDKFLKFFDRNLINLKDLNLEGFFTPAIEIYKKDGNLSILIEIDKVDSKWVVSRITLYDKDYKTKEGITVGSNFKELKEKYKISSIDFSEGFLYAIVDELEMSFKFENNEKGKIGKPLIPDNSKIISILIY